MNEKKSNAPLVAIIAVVAVVLLAVPCLLGAMFLGGLLMWQRAPQPQPPFPPPAPIVVPEPQVEPMPSE